MLAKMFEVAAVALAAVFLALLLVEWMAGCGETYVDAAGVRHQNQCMFVPIRE